MPTYSPSPRPTFSPWGSPDNAEQLIPGIWSVDTPSHGGFLLSEQRQAAMPAALARPGGVYEEDCDWALVVLAFEGEFATLTIGTKGWIQLSHDTVKCRHPDSYTQFTGIAVEPNESHVLKRRAAYRERVGKICVTSAWGDWAEWVPAGKVGVVGQRVLDVSHLGHATFEAESFRGLCDKRCYEARGDVNSFDELDVELIAAE